MSELIPIGGLLSSLKLNRRAHIISYVAIMTSLYAYRRRRGADPRAALVRRHNNTLIVMKIDGKFVPRTGRRGRVKRIKRDIIPNVPSISISLCL